MVSLLLLIVGTVFDCPRGMWWCTRRSLCQALSPGQLQNTKKSVILSTVPTVAILLLQKKKPNKMSYIRSGYIVLQTWAGNKKIYRIKILDLNLLRYLLGWKVTNYTYSSYCNLVALCVGLIVIFLLFFKKYILLEVTVHQYILNSYISQSFL